jgi:hypothetical protein
MRIILIFSLFIAACSNSNDNKKTVKFLNQQDSVSNYKFSLASLDSAIINITGCELLEIQVTQMDSIREYTGLLDAFNKVNGLQSISYKYSKNSTLSLNKTLMPGHIIQLKFNSIDNAQNSFLAFEEDLLKGNINGKIALKSGGICFVESNIIYIIPISTCGNNHQNINTIEQVIKEQIFYHNDFKGIKMYCSLGYFERLGR